MVKIGRANWNMGNVSSKKISWNRVRAPHIFLKKWQFQQIKKPFMSLDKISYQIFWMQKMILVSFMSGITIDNMCLLLCSGKDSELNFKCSWRYMPDPSLSSKMKLNRLHWQQIKQRTPSTHPFASSRKRSKTKQETTINHHYWTKSAQAPNTKIKRPL